MTTHFLLHHTTPTALLRWRKAFPDAIEGSEPAPLLERLRAGDTVWIDARRPDWLESVRSLAASPWRPHIAVLSPAPNAEEAARALDAGARAYSHVFALPEQFEEVAVVLEHGGWWLGPDLMRAASRVASRIPKTASPLAGMAGLSAREREVAQAVARGLSNKEVAQVLGITERTVKAHLSAAFEKLGVRDRLQLALRMADDVPDVEETE